MNNDRLIKIKQNLYQTQPKTFYSHYTAGYYLLRPEGNILIDPPEDIQLYREELYLLGRPVKAYITHNHKVSARTKVTLESWGISYERPGLWSWSQGQKVRKIDEGLKIIRAPGHTEDSVIISWLDQERVSWFTGDTLYPENGQVVRTVAYSDNNKLLNQTIQFLKGFRVDQLYGSVSDSRVTLNLAFNSREDWVYGLKRCQEQYSF